MRSISRCCSTLTDSFGRFHNYLRISLTEKCNLRCVYCMPLEGVQLTSKPELLTPNEFKTIIRLFADLGVDKIRFTGGEPTVSKHLCDLVRYSRSIDSIKSVGITTNGILLNGQLDSLCDAGLTNVNISLDTLIPQRFGEITRREDKLLFRVISAIFAAVAKGLVVKINCVVMRESNLDELTRFIELTKEIKLHIRFIEVMPFDHNNWTSNSLVSFTEMIDILRHHGYIVYKSESVDPHDTTKWYHIESLLPVDKSVTDDEYGDEDDIDDMAHQPGLIALKNKHHHQEQQQQAVYNSGQPQHQHVSPRGVEEGGEEGGNRGISEGTVRHQGKLGFITSMSSQFCSGCNRLRITADGKLKLCLFGEESWSIRDAIRSNLSDAELRNQLKAAIMKKKKALGGAESPEQLANTKNRPMILIGG